MPKRPTAPVLIKKEASDLLSPPTTSIPVTPIKTKSQAGPRSKSTPEFKSKYTTVGTPTPTPIPESETSNRPDLNPTDPSLKLKKERSEDDLDLSSPWPGKKRKISGTGGDPGDMKSPGKKGRGAAWGDGKKSKLARFSECHDDCARRRDGTVRG
jgi:hypothetical protein